MTIWTYRFTRPNEADTFRKQKEGEHLWKREPHRHAPHLGGGGRRARSIFVVGSALAVAALTIGLASCAPSGSSTTSKGDDDGTAAIAVAWSADGDCGTCHDTESHSFEDSTTSASFHASQSCADCHDDVDTLATVHEGVTTDDLVPKRLKKTTVASETCLGCHDQAELVQATADSTVLTDSEGTVVNPHQLPETASGVHGEIVCADCHELHGDASELDTDAKNYCLSCHHADVFQCNTCHVEK